MPAYLPVGLSITVLVAAGCGDTGSETESAADVDVEAILARLDGLEARLEEAEAGMATNAGDIADNVSDISTWHDPEGILELCTVVAGSRPMATATPPDPELVSRIVFVETPAIDISSTRIRQRLRDGLPVRGLIPAGVEEYIRAERLYR